MPRVLLACLTLVALAACTPSKPVDTPPPTAAVAAPIPSQGGFSPLRPTEIEAPGTGAWVCTPAGAGMRSRCVPRGVATRPALVPGMAMPVTDVVDPPIEGPSTAEVLAKVRAQQELAMETPQP